MDRLKTIVILLLIILVIGAVAVATRTPVMRATGESAPSGTLDTTPAAISGEPAEGDADSAGIDADTEAAEAPAAGPGADP